MSDTLRVRLSGRAGALAIDAAFTVPPGITALQGPSGAGKTTLLRAIAGLERLQGSVHIGGEVWQDAQNFLPPHRRRIGFVFQGANLLPHLSVRANLAYAARRAEAPLSIEDIAERTGIAHLLNRRPAKLSGGEAQRVALARALLIRPKLLLLDEPFTGLDAEGRAGLIDQLAALLRTLATPVLIVTHDAGEAARIAHQQLHIDNGTITVCS
ncbi:molybdate transport system ATP-binding protein [Sphingomonas vulcanisoli]|uniref:Molybdate transport system ATP-binding protein n=1 Tax=Sphingomonas vulcanisoli TaxID=1658060 RepID=A0ABX0TR63_9SPHN|nr:ATP-binding cassette domain-containing protein [Sphingomonas vulcanisoli]NIJ08017.1 molybdate transport system ATP-binding protein [Sphingomonas vulcanisoli]